MNDPVLEKHCWAEIDLDALRHNFAFIRRTVGGPVCAVVKADATATGTPSWPPCCSRRAPRPSP